MPTGYTADVQDGKVTEFRDFLMQCARAFGACISLRDEPLDASIPEEFKPSTYHAERLAEAKADLVRLEAMADRDIARAAARPVRATPSCKPLISQALILGDNQS